jgi:hypothetical protein
MASELRQAAEPQLVFDSAPEQVTLLRPSFPCTGADLRAARACERVVFGRHFGNSAADLADEYGPYESSTDFGGVFLPDGTAVGAIRLLRNGWRGLKSLNDAAGPPWRLPVQATCEAADIDPAQTWDVGSLGVDSQAAGSSHQATLALLSVLFGAFRDNEVASFVAIIDMDARRPIGALGLHLLDLPGAMPGAYFGSEASIPVYRHVRDLHRLHLSGSADVHQQIFHGRGVTGLDPRACQPGAFALDAA